MNDGPEPGGMPPDPSLVVRFGGDKGVDVPAVVEGAQAELKTAELRLQAAQRLADAQERLDEWLAADPANPRLLLDDPQAALAKALPDVDVPEFPAGGREILSRLISDRPVHDAGLIGYRTPEARALELLRAVADDAGGKANGYAALFADVQGTVTTVAGGRYSADVIGRVVDGILRAGGVAVLDPSRALATPVAPSALATFLEQHPDIRKKLGGGPPP